MLYHKIKYNVEEHQKKQCCNREINRFVTGSKFARVPGNFTFCRTWPGSVTSCYWLLPGNFIILLYTSGWRLGNKIFYDNNNTLLTYKYENNYHS